MTDETILDDETELTDRLIQAVTKLSPQRKKMLEALLREWERLDYREDSRIPCFLPVDYSTSDRVYQDFINNLSNGGVFIETAASLHVGESLSLIFTVPIAAEIIQDFRDDHPQGARWYRG